MRMEPLSESARRTAPRYQVRQPAGGPEATAGAASKTAAMTYLQREAGNSAVAALLAAARPPQTAVTVQRILINVPLHGVGIIETDQVPTEDLQRLVMALEALQGPTETILVTNALARLRDVIASRPSGFVSADIRTPGRTVYWIMAPSGRHQIGHSGRLADVINRLNPHPHRRNYSRHGGRGSYESPTGSYLRPSDANGPDAYHVLPAHTTYVEAVYNLPDQPPGLTRVILGADGSIYFTDDHYHIYYRVHQATGGAHVQFGQ